MIDAVKKVAETHPEVLLLLAGNGPTEKELREQIDFGMFYPIQKAAVAALTGPLDMVRKQCTDYEERRDVLCACGLVMV